MNILLFTNNLASGGAERVTATLANYWAQRNWEVTVVTLAPTADDFFSLDPAVRRVSLNLSAASRNAVHGLRQNIVRVVALRRILKQIRPTVAIAMMSTPNVLLAFASHGIATLHTVGSERCYPPHAPLGPLWTALRKRAYGRLSAVVALTRECGRWVETHTSARRVPVIPNAVAYPLRAGPPWIAPDALIAPARRVLLTVGRLAAVKNFELLIRVFSRLAISHDRWDLVILGEGPERASLAASIRELGLTDRIFLPGLAGNVAQWHSRADLYVLTSLSEGFPNALAEALCNGLPAVSFDCDTGPRDIIRHGVDGLLVTPDDGAALALALDLLMKDDDLRQQFAARASEAQQRFSIDKIAGMWEALLQELADARMPSMLGRQVPGEPGYRP